MDYDKIADFLANLAGDDLQVEEILDPEQGWELSYQYADTYYAGSGWGDHYSETELPEWVRDTLVGATPLSLMALLLSHNNGPDDVSGPYGVGLDEEVAKSLEYDADRAADTSNGERHEWVWVTKVERDEKDGGYILHCRNTTRPRIKAEMIMGNPLAPDVAPWDMKGAMFLTWSAAGTLAEVVPVSNKARL